MKAQDPGPVVVMMSAETAGLLRVDFPAQVPFILKWVAAFLSPFIAVLAGGRVGIWRLVPRRDDE